MDYSKLTNDELAAIGNAVFAERAARTEAQRAEVRKLVADLPAGWSSWAWDTGVNLYFNVGDLSLAVTLTRVADRLQYASGWAELNSDDSTVRLLTLPGIHSPTFPGGSPSIADVLRWAKAQVWMHLLRQAAAFTDKPATPDNMEGSLGLSTTDAEADND